MYSMTVKIVRKILQLKCLPVRDDEKLNPLPKKNIKRTIVINKGNFKSLN